MIIAVQNKFLPEKKYILEVIFNRFLGLEFELRTSENPVYSIQIPNGKKVIFEDHFFSRFSTPDEAYTKENLPHEVIKIQNKLAPETDLIILYGTDKAEQAEDFVFGADLFASAFFMLTRWEEMIATSFDKFGRFEDENSTAFKFGFFDRPIVNEYVEFLWKLLQEIGFVEKRLTRKFKPFITHDIDELYRFGSIKRFLRALAGDLIVRKSINAFFKTTKDFKQIIQDKKPDNYDTFEMLMDISESNQLKSAFYFIPGEMGETDVRYSIHDPKVNAIIHQIKSRGHEVGLHGSYDSFEDEYRFDSELKRLKGICSEIEGGRQHYLRIKIPETFRYWAKNGLNYDSTLGFYRDGGFRAGVCFPFPIYDIKQRKKLNLIERPITVMDVALSENYFKPDVSFDRMLHFIGVVKKYKGEFVLIWHNSSFNTWNWNDDWHRVYYKTLEELSS